MNVGMKNVKTTRRAVPGWTNHKFLILTIVVLAIFSGVACIVAFVVFSNRELTRRAHLQATATAEAVLTEMYGAEVSQIIENFELKWHSYEAYIDPNVGTEVATDPFFHARGYAKFGEAIYDWPTWSVITSAQVSKIRVVEYTGNRIKAVSLVGRIFSDVTPEGVVVEAKRPNGICGVYVFSREDNMWKLKAFFNTAGNASDIEREWQNSAWLREIIEELPSYWDICLH